MSKTIDTFIQQIISDHNVQLLYACESGSRAWGFHSPDSDYDVRFIFMHPSNAYLSIFEPQDSITCMDGLLDGSGWDLLKSLRLAAKSNVSIFEWLQSPVVYHNANSFREKLWQAVLPYFQPKTAMHHYLGIASSTLHRNFKEEEVLLKKYFYVLRPVFAARFIAITQQPAPTQFAQLVRFYEDEVEIENIIKYLLEQKAKASEGQMIKRNKQLDNFIEQEMNQLLTIAKSMPRTSFDRAGIDHFYRSMLQIDN